MKIQCIIVLLLFCCIISIQSANNIKELEKQRKMLFIDIKNANKFLSENQKSIKNVQQKVDLIVKQIDTREQLVKIIKNETGVLGKQIQEREIKIAQLREILQLKKECYAIAIQKIYQKKNNQDQLFFILSAYNIAHSFHSILYLKEYSKWRKSQGEEIIVKHNTVFSEKRILEHSIKGKKKLVNVKRNEEEKLQIQKETKEIEIKNLKKNTKKIQSEIDRKRIQAKVLDREIAKIIKEEIAAVKQTSVKVNVKRKNETIGNYLMTRDEQVLSADFSKNKGKLPFPIRGNYRIISRFGQQQYSNMENILYNSNGIDIKTVQDNTARAVFDGIVTRIFILPGYQTSVIVRHGNYLTLYSCLEQVFVRKGEKIKSRQIIGKIYTDREKENSTVLHFELWKEQMKLNPEIWLYQ